MAKILIITGKAAAPIIRDIVKRIDKHKVDIFIAPIPIAAFITPEYVVSLLSNSSDIDVKSYDIIMLPGLCKGSAKVIEERLGVRAVKGPINAYDLLEVLKLDDFSLLSPDEPADNVMGNVLRSLAKSLLSDVEREVCRRGCIYVGKLKVPITPPPMRIATEVCEAHVYRDEDIIKKVEQYIDSGADIISIGFEALEPHPDHVERVIKLIRKNYDIPIALDTSIPSEIIRGIEAGADMVINITLQNIEDIYKYLRDVAVVVIPFDIETKTIPISIDRRIEILERTIDVLKQKNIEKVFADVVLDPPGSTLASLIGFYEFKKRYPDIPLFMGVGNVTELIDADSIGVNAIMAMFAQEVGASILLTVEESPKAKGSTLELKIATQIATISYVKKSLPKNLGIDLLVVKDKRRYYIDFDEEVNEVVLATNEDVQYSLDPLGIFKIRVNHDEGVIEALYIGRKGKILIKGRTAKAIRNEILLRGLISQLSHAFYLGMELAKAEEALRLGKNYIQEFPLFKKLEYIK